MVSPGGAAPDRASLRMIAPGDSFTAVFTPKRAGTFMYHTHVNDIRQLSGGLYGPLIVLEPGQKYDPAVDHVFAIGQQGENEPGWIVVNGSPSSAPLRFKAGVKHRLRFFSMTVDDIADVILENDSGPAKWTPVAKDGAPVPPSSRTPRPARMQDRRRANRIDFEFTPQPGEYRMRVMSYTNVLLTIIVK